MQKQQFEKCLWHKWKITLPNFIIRTRGTESTSKSHFFVSLLCSPSTWLDWHKWAPILTFSINLANIFPPFLEYLWGSKLSNLPTLANAPPKQLQPWQMWKLAFSFCHSPSQAVPDMAHMGNRLGLHGNFSQETAEHTLVIVGLG